MTSPTKNEDAFTVTLRKQLELTSSYEEWLDELVASGKDYGGIAPKVKSRLQRYSDWLGEAIEGKNEAGELYFEEADEEDDSWAIQLRTKPEGKDLTIVVTGPGPDDRSEIKAKDEKEAEFILSVCMTKHPKVPTNLPMVASILTRFCFQDKYLGYISKAVSRFNSPFKFLCLPVYYVQCRAFSDTEKDMRSLAKLVKSLSEEKGPLCQPPEVTFREHIRLLKGYNDIKDIGQQLIGLIAENKGVPVGTLYEEDQYGVKADD